MEHVSGSSEGPIASPEEASAEHRQSSARAAAAAQAQTREAALYLLVGAVFIGFAFWWLQFSTPSICCGDFDAYYHFKWSRMLWEGIRSGHFPPTFDVLPLTTLNSKDYVDHHLLFHVLQIPFTWFSDMRLGAKVGTWLFASLAVFSCYWMIVRQRLSYPLVWLIALLGCAAPFLYRMNMGKAMSISIAMLVIGIHLLFERRYVWLLPLAFVFALTYDMVFLLWIAAGVWAVVIAWSEAFDDDGPAATFGGAGTDWRARAANVFRSTGLRWAAAGVGFVVVGTVLGYVINPYFPHNLQLVYEHFIIKVRAGDFPTRVGNEWYAYDSWEFLGNCLLAFAAMVCGYVAFSGTDRRGTQRALFFLVFATVLLVVNARWRRFSEYWPPFAILFAAFSLQPLFDGARAHIRRLPSDVLDELQPFLDAQQRPAAAEREQRERRAEYVAASLVAAVLGVLLFYNMRVTAKDIAGMAGPEHYRGSMAWISKNVPRGELIFNTDWDDFPKMFYYDAEHPVVSGLDPTYLFDQNRPLAELYERIGTGKEENPGPLIRERFCLGEGPTRRCARYVFTDREHEEFINIALDSGWFDAIYINVFARTDGLALSDADFDEIREHAPQENLDWIVLDDGRRAVSATTLDFKEEHLHALEERFKVNSDSMVFRVRDAKGAPAPEEDDNGDNDDDGSADAENNGER